MSAATAAAARLPTYYLSHGGGPWPWMKDQAGGMFDRLEQSLVAIRAELGERPRALLLISGHWETPGFAVSAGERPGMVFDYYGFPQHLYRISYPAPGSPQLAARVRELLERGGVGCALDPQRGFDHGTFSLAKPLYPEADMPIVQLSIRGDFDPAAHLEVGRLLAPLRDEGVVIVGSGSSYHNLRQLGPVGRAPSKTFDGWLQDTLVGTASDRRSEQLQAWTRAPAARQAQPREDHLVPLFVAVGAAEDDPGACVYHQDDFMGCALSSFRFGEPPAYSG